MKKYFLIPAILAFCSSLVQAQMGSPNLSPGLSDAMARVFGTNLNFSAALHTDVNMAAQNQTMSMTGKMYFRGGDSRSEMDMSQATGTLIPPQAIAQMKAMGMDKMISISQNSQKTTYVIYPGLQAYAKMQEPNTDSQTNAVKVDTTDLGKETLDGHPCLKKQFILTDPGTGQQLTMITWNATDLNNIPIQVQQTVSGSNGAGKTSMTMHFTDITMGKADAGLFQPPAGYTAYTDIRTMMQTEMAKKMGGGAGMPQ
jgi:hypothetical protein